MLIYRDLTIADSGRSRPRLPLGTDGRRFPGEALMEIEVIALAAAASLLAAAIFTARQPALMAAVMTYAAVVGWIIQHDLTLLMAALGLAIVLSTVGLVTVVCREISSHDDTYCPTARKLKANNRAAISNIGL